jgi:hypothetical protein
VWIVQVSFRDELVGTVVMVRIVSKGIEICYDSSSLRDGVATEFVIAVDSVAQAKGRRCAYTKGL